MSRVNDRRALLFIHRLGIHLPRPRSFTSLFLNLLLMQKKVCISNKTDSTGSMMCSGQTLKCANAAVGHHWIACLRRGTDWAGRRPGLLTSPSSQTTGARLEGEQLSLVVTDSLVGCKLTPLSK